MNSGALKRAKRQIRRAVLEERDALSPGVRAERGERIARRVVELPEVRPKVASKDGDSRR